MTTFPSPVRDVDTLNAALHGFMHCFSGDTQDCIARSIAYARDHGMPENDTVFDRMSFTRFPEMMLMLLSRAAALLQELPPTASENEVNAALERLSPLTSQLSTPAVLRKLANPVSWPVVVTC